MTFSSNVEYDVISIIFAFEYFKIFLIDNILSLMAKSGFSSQSIIPDSAAKLIT